MNISYTSKSNPAAMMMKNTAAFLTEIARRTVLRPAQTSLSIGS